MTIIIIMIIQIVQRHFMYSGLIQISWCNIQIIDPTNASLGLATTYERSLSAKRGILILSTAQAHRRYRPFQATPCAAEVIMRVGGYSTTLLSREALPQDAYTKYTLYTTYEYVRVLVSQLAAIFSQISYLKIDRLSFSPCSLLLLLSSTSTEMLVSK